MFPVSTVRNISVLRVSTLQLSVNISTVQSCWPATQVRNTNTVFFQYGTLSDMATPGNKSSLVQLIQSYGLNVQVAFLGPNLEYVVDYFERYVYYI